MERHFKVVAPRLETVGEVDTPRERLVGFDASKTRLGLIFRKHALELSMLVSQIVDKRRSAPLIMKFNSRADIDQVIPGNCLYVPVNS